MTPDQVAALFTRSDGAYAFARWGRPVSPVVFGVEETSLGTIKGAIEAVVQASRHDMSDADPELGANLMIFFLRDWAELADTPNLDHLIPEPALLVARLKRVDASQYRTFRFDKRGAIKACFVFLLMDQRLVEMPAADLALTQAVHAMLLWSEQAFADKPPLVTSNPTTTVLRPEIAAVLRAAYDPVLPAAASDPSHALRLFARLPNPI